MKLPLLPKQYKQKEADFGIEFRHSIKRNPIETSSIELKHTRGKDSFPFSEFKPKQEAYAKKIESDEGVLIRVQGVNGEPDYIYLRNEIAYITIKYPKGSVMITVNNFIHARNTLKRKSLTYEQAVAIAHKIIHI